MLLDRLMQWYFHNLVCTFYFHFGSFQASVPWKYYANFIVLQYLTQKQCF